jgi:signal transduction histidine kinase
MTGSGLGLAIVAQIARNHGGHVWAADNPLGVGAEVGFAIPVSDPTAASLV